MLEQVEIIEQSNAIYAQILAKTLSETKARRIEAEERTAKAAKPESVKNYLCGIRSMLADKKKTDKAQKSNDPRLSRLSAFHAMATNSGAV